MKRNFKNLVFVSLAFLTFSSCENVAEVYTGDDVLVGTLYDKSAPFNAYSTYTISDTIAVVSDGIDKNVTGADADAVIANIVDNLSSRGFTRINRFLNPNLGVNVTVFKNLNVETYYPGYWYGYGGYYGGGYYGYPGYSYYYPWSYTYTYTTGTIMLEIIDLKNKNTANNTIKVIWTTLVNGFAEGGKSVNEVNGYIDQAFEQSPYIKAN